ncbi:MAG TPA: monovalent cation/H+ antiporter complex subunit F [Candidatus Krumholzibacteria bacterium]|nr:monovalent cation/H+ antiporter complex subunit F [Candidatus Krumholzibacteria bacterium]
MVFLSVITIIIGFALILPLYRVLRGPTVYDRMVGVTVAGTKTVILICLAGFLYGRIDMFVDIAIAYAMLNFVGALVVGKYLERSGTGGR